MRSSNVQPRIAILGGSTPFTASLIDALGAVADSLQPMTLVIHGRRVELLQLMTAYAERVLAKNGWSVTSSTDLAESLDESNVVVHQIRYGGLHERSIGELLSARLDVPADETLGPAALYAGIRMTDGLQLLAAGVKAYCPQAVVLNLTNPLSSSTAIVQRGLATPILGACELPLYTVLIACRKLNVPPHSVHWAYSGLNHRGFIHHLSYQGRDLLPELVESLGADTIGGITAEEIADLQALPLKYFLLLRSGGHGPTVSRSLYLTELRHHIAEELRANLDSSPPSLAERDPIWYADAVVPLMVALVRACGDDLIVNRAHADGLVYEELAHVSSHGIEPLQAEPAPAPAAAWVKRFVEHESLAVAACLDPSFSTVCAALEADPLVPIGRAQSSARVLLQTLSAPTEAEPRPAHDPRILTT
jgi:6-phospho-beta-glucosidase